MLASDIAEIKKMDRAVFSPEEQYDDSIYDVMPQSMRSVVAENGGGLIVGYAFVDPGERPRANGEIFGHIRSIAVHPDHRRQGYGKALLEAVIAGSIGDVDLLVDEDNVPAIRLYQSLGFGPAEICTTVPPKRRMILNREARLRC